MRTFSFEWRWAVKSEKPTRPRRAWMLKTNGTHLNRSIFLNHKQIAKNRTERPKRVADFSRAIRWHSECVQRNSTEMMMLALPLPLPLAHHDYSIETINQISFVFISQLHNHSWGCEFATRLNDFSFLYYCIQTAPSRADVECKLAYSVFNWIFFKQ